MRLDHLLSKEKIIVNLFCHRWVLVSTWLVASFSSLLGAGEVPGGGGFCFQVKRVLHAFRVCGVVGVDEAKAFAVFRPSWLEGFCRADVFVF